MKKQTKAELSAQIDALTCENSRLQEAADAVQRKQWTDNLFLAQNEFTRHTKRVFPGMVCNARFEHVDAGGYWFTFELKNDSRRQTYCIRHSDMN